MCWDGDEVEAYQRKIEKARFAGGLPALAAAARCVIRKAVLALACFCSVAGAPAEESKGKTQITPVYLEKILEVSELRIMDQLTYRGETELLKAIGRGRMSPETPVHRLNLTLRRMVQLEDKFYVIGVFESGGFSSVSPEPLIVVLFTSDYDVVTWKVFEAYTGMGAAFVRYAHGIFKEPAELVLVYQRGRSITGDLGFLRIAVSKSKLEFLGESAEWKPGGPPPQ